jgi:hypothetical protein
MELEALLRELLDCTELNLDDLEPATRAVIERAVKVLKIQEEP